MELDIKKINERMLFNKIKDKLEYDSCQKIRNDYKELNVDFRELYVKIINYRIEKYGTSIFMQYWNNFDKPVKKINYKRYKLIRKGGTRC